MKNLGFGVLFPGLLVLAQDTYIHYPCKLDVWDSHQGKYPIIGNQNKHIESLKKSNIKVLSCPLENQRVSYTTNIDWFYTTSNYCGFPQVYLGTVAWLGILSPPPAHRIMHSTISQDNSLRSVVYIHLMALFPKVIMYSKMATQNK